MSQADEYETAEAYQQHSNDSEFHGGFSLSWDGFGQHIDIEATVDTVGAAVHEGAEKFEKLMRTIVKTVMTVCTAALMIAIAFIAQGHIGSTE
ncbi:hypothetical protein [Haloplanus salilacus]|uniref:hypothetical protein n=1 Tax=Haloplanus salilacus TaxID=2949994 RepID=UPI0030D5A3A6